MELIKKDLPDSKFSTCLFLGLWIGWLFNGVICLYGLYDTNIFSDFIVHNIHLHVIALVVFAIICFIRYFKFIKFERIEEYRNCLNPTKRFFMYLLFQLFLFGSPIFLFVTFRLYKYGQVAWW